MATSTAAPTDPDLPWTDVDLAPEERATLLVEALSLEQKLQQLTGAMPEIVPELPECYGARHVTGIPELAIPTLRITNGPVGLGQNDCVDASLADDPTIPFFGAYTHPSSAAATALPSAPTVAASFDTDVAGAFGDVIATEMHNLALHVFEAPGLNMARLPVLGRNFEYFGEDPYLTGAMGVAEIRAIQDQGLIAMAKHFVANEQEVNRMGIQTTVDERTLHEMYLLPFEMAVRDGEVASVMCAYNYVNGVHSCENDYLQNDVLRDQWGFEGYVQSDFFATKSTVETLLGGMDHMMPIPLQWAPEELTAALDAGEIDVAHIDRALHRRYTQMFKAGIFERPIVQTPIDYDAGGAEAREIGVQGGVLLQNNGALPIDPDVEHVVVIGKATQTFAQQAVAGGALVGEPLGSGGGSSDVVPVYTVAPVEGIENVLADLGNADAQVDLVLVDDANTAAWVNDDDATFEEALALAAEADAVVIMAGTIAEEGADRATFTATDGLERVEIGDSLDWYADRSNIIATVDGDNAAKNSNTVAMIDAVLSAAPGIEQRTTLVLKDNAGVALDPALVGSDGPAILETWFPGQEDGHIVADLLLGVANPSGKLPFTFPYEGRGFLDNVTAEQYPGVVIDGEQTVEYTERLNIGYRWYDANVSGECEADATGANPCVAFAFGHGLSYTEFALSNPAVDTTVTDGVTPVVVSFDVTNTGELAGAEVGQVYLSLPESAGEPPKRLVGFEKVSLDPGQTVRVEVAVDPAASNHPLSFWDETTRAWTTPDGEFAIHVGNASDNLAEPVYFTVDSQLVAPIEVTPAAVTFTDEPGTADDTYTVPQSDGVEYVVDGEVVAAGTYPGVGTVTVDARAADGYVLAEAVTSRWSHTFDDTPAPTPGDGEPTDDGDGSPGDGDDNGTTGPTDGSPAGPGGSLPSTGAAIGGWVALTVLALLALGGAFVAVRRRALRHAA